jgi:Tfp pilus assembly protein PilF
VVVEDKRMQFRHGLGGLALASGVMLLLTAATAAPSGTSAIAPLSQQFAAQGQAALDKKQPTAAIDAFETALAVDPKNTSAYIGIAKAYEAQGMPGKSVKYYREALAINPNDIAALEGQGLALVARGATARAQVNLERIKTLCKGDCAAAKTLQTAMNAASAKPAVTASAEPAKPIPAKN